jgi:hypothetical protein
MTTHAPTPPEVFDELQRLLLTLESSTEDDGQAIATLVRDGLVNPLGPEEAVALLDRVLDRLTQRAAADDDDDLVANVQAARSSLRARVSQPREGSPKGSAHAPGGGSTTASGLLHLEGHDGIDPHPVHPKPTFYGREIPLMAGFVDVRDVVLWVGNERLEVHMEQFDRKWRRPPSPQELLDIMGSNLQLEGLEEEDDQFKIIDLARSIANNGVRRPPVIDRDGTLLDGNRRVAACHYVLTDDEFTPEQKRRAERLFVWQLTEHSGPEDRDRVVVALNFEPDLKQEWPEYVKARKVADEWRAILDLQPTAPNRRRAAELKRELSLAFALGPDTGTVNRYVKMVELADEFEEHQVVERHRDPSAVKHAASRHFQYFDELGKGARPGGVAYTLGQDDTLRHLVFDLLYQGKVRNWRQIRKLKYAADNEDVVDQLKLARDISDVDDAQEKVDFALALGETTSKETRELGANTRIEAFTKWLRGLPMDAFASGAVKEANVEALVRALAITRQQAIPVLGEQRVEELAR